MTPGPRRPARRPIRAWLTRLVCVAALLYGTLCAALFATQDSLLYFPTPSALDQDGTTLELTVEGAELHIRVRPTDGPQALIYFGGNAEDVSLTLPSFSAAFPEHALFLPHYRGYGGSSGQPSEQALHSDALDLFDRVHADHPNIVLVGRSLGSGVAIRLARERRATRLILITPFDSLVGVAADLYPLFPVRWLMRDTYDSGRHAPAIEIPTLIIAAEHDQVIPRASTDLLRSRFAPGIASFVVLPGTGHNSISSSSAYLETLRRGL